MTFPPKVLRPTVILTFSVQLQQGLTQSNADRRYFYFVLEVQVSAKRRIRDLLRKVKLNFRTARQESTEEQLTTLDDEDWR